MSSLLTVIFITKDKSLGNFTWGGGCILLTLYTFIFGSSYYPRQIIATLLIGIWGIRLSSYLLYRYHKKEDLRFKDWKVEWTLRSIGETIWWVCGFQLFLLLIMSAPIIIINLCSGAGFNMLDCIGTAGYIMGFIIENIADYQLYRFTSNSAHDGQIMKEGLWRYSRHPNYFGESVMWWSLYLIAFSVPYGFLTIGAPITIYLTLRYFSAPLIEKKLANNPDYQEYQARTNMFIPLPPQS